jgi:trk system potassium uptake protein TrkA
VGRRIARLRNREFSREKSAIDLEKIGITSIIHPENVLVDHIMQFIETPRAVESANFESGRILMRGYRVTEWMELSGKTTSEIRAEIAPHVLLFAAVVRNGKGIIPDGNERLQPGDLVYSLFPRESLERFLELVGVESKPSRKIVITGDSFSTVQLAEALDDTDHKVIFIDPDIEHAEKCAPKFNNVEVIHGDCTELDVLREINVEAASFFIACSDAADYNMLSALLARSEGAHEVMAVTTESHHGKIFSSIGIDHVLNPRLTTAREILETISRGHIGAVVRLSDIDIEAVRFTVEPHSYFAGRPIKKMSGKLKKGSIVGMVVREDRMILPSGDTVIEAGDHVIMITHHKDLKAISKLFQP